MDREDPQHALELKEAGNRAFQGGEYVSADALYSKAIVANRSNPILWTNRAMARLKLKYFDSVISDCDESLKLLPENMKAHFYMAQALLEINQPKGAEAEARIAYEFCQKGTDKASERNLGPVGNLVLRSKKAAWDQKEDERLQARNGLLEEILSGLRSKAAAEILSASTDIEADKAEEKWNGKIEETRRLWGLGLGRESQRRQVPDWAIDDITFGIMIDPVITKTGNSYERASIIEHLHRTPTDPLTREPLRPDELRPNLGLKKACEEFLAENGWAVDW